MPLKRGAESEEGRGTGGQGGERELVLQVNKKPADGSVPVTAGQGSGDLGANSTTGTYF